MNRQEFRFLPSDAARVGRITPLPDVNRITLAAAPDSGRSLSALQFTDRDPEYVFFHGVGLNAHSFDPVILSLDRPAVSVDLPGHGRSDWRDDADYRPKHLADDLAEALDQITKSPVHLVGHSLGGLAASLVAERRPQLIRSLTLIDVTPSLTSTGASSSVIEFIRGQEDFESVDEIVDRAIAFGIGSDRVSLTRGVELNTRVRQDGRLVWSHHFGHTGGTPATTTQAEHPGAVGASSPRYTYVWGSLERSPVTPALILGSEGIVAQREVEEWVKRLPGTSVVTLDGGHNLHEHAPRELASTLRELTQSTQS